MGSLESLTQSSLCRREIKAQRGQARSGQAPLHGPQDVSHKSGTASEPRKVVPKAGPSELQQQLAQRAKKKRVYRFSGRRATPRVLSSPPDHHTAQNARNLNHLPRGDNGHSPKPSLREQVGGGNLPADSGWDDLLVVGYCPPSQQTEATW